MSMAALRSNIAQMAQMAAARNASMRVGLVTSVDPATYSAKVSLQPAPAEGDAPETGWLPVWSPWVGNGWGFYALPARGDQVLVLFLEGDVQAGLVLGALYSDEDRPLTAPQGELWVQHTGGAFLKFQNDGSVHMKAPSGLAIEANTTITGTLHTTQDITCDTTVTATTDVVGGGKHLKTHTHTDPQGGVTGQPV